MTALKHVIGWFDSWAGPRVQASGGRKVHWARLAPFVFLHLGCLGVLWVGWSPVAVAVAIAFYLLRVFFIAGFYHRYFSHKTYKTSRTMQFVFGVLGLISDMQPVPAHVMSQRGRGSRGVRMPSSNARADRDRQEV